MSTDDGLFDAPAPVDLPPAEAKLSPDRRRTMRNLATLQRGRHPLKNDLLHPDAPAVDDRKADGPRCGNCGYIVNQGGVAGSYLKCALGPITGGPSTDVRQWWPGCSTWRAV